MYKLLLVLRYLRRKLAPLFAAMAVMLCTAMVIIVISVMGGFLQMLRDAARTLSGQVTVGAGMTGFAEYDRLIDLLEDQPEVAAATPIIRAVGLVNLDGQVLTVEVIGIDPVGLDRVTGYRGSLYWTRKHLHEDVMGYRGGGEPATAVTGQSGGSGGGQTSGGGDNDSSEPAGLDPVALGMTLVPPPRWKETKEVGGIVMGIEVSPFSQRDERGRYHLIHSALGREVTLTVLPLTQRGTLLEPSVSRMVVVNEFKSGLYEVDAHRVYVPFGRLQQMLKMDAVEQADPETGQPTGFTESARAGEVMVVAGPGVGLQRLARVVSEQTQRFTRTYPQSGLLWVQTWQQRHATLLGAVEKEKLLLTFLFAIISVVAVAMIGVIFYMIVLEKTRDIGVLRALGASRQGVMSIFLGYGLAIGLVGAGLGLALAAAVVNNINQIQGFLTRHVGFTMWDPSVYYFDRVPSRLDPVEVAVILVMAVFSSMLGSLVPAYAAGRVDPVESLRYE